MAYSAVTLLVMYMHPPHATTVEKAVTGAFVASLLLAVAAYFLVGKGLSLGKRIVSRPQFVPHLAGLGLGRDLQFVTAAQQAGKDSSAQADFPEDLIGVKTASSQQQQDSAAVDSVRVKKAS